MEAKRIALLGLGEAGSLIAADLVAAGAEVIGYDPRPVAALAGVEMVRSESEAAERAAVVLSVNWASAALDAAQAAAAGLAPGKVYAELNTGSPSLKRKVAEVISPTGASFVDVALMSNVPGKGVRTPMLAAGPSASEFARVLETYGATVDVLYEGEPGDAARRKLLRSVFMKGFGSVVVEALEAARLAGLEGWMEAQIQDVLKVPGEAKRFDAGTRKHAVRRLHEMEASLDLLTELGAPTTVTRATVANLRRLADQRNGPDGEARRAVRHE